MHELSITRSIVAAVAERARGRRVHAVTLQIGSLSGFDGNAVRFCFDACTAGTSLAGAELRIETVAGRGRCGACGDSVALADLVGRCTCPAGGPIRVEAGQEMIIRSMEVADV